MAGMDDGVVRPFPALPIRGRFPFRPGRREARRVRAMAAALRTLEPELASGASAYRGAVAGLGPGPSLLLHDLSRTRPWSRCGASLLEYRALLLAGDGDLVAVGVPRSQAFEAHVAAVLGLEGVRVLRVRGVEDGKLAPAALRDEALLDEAAARAREAGSLVIRPYQGVAPVWRLASAIAARAGVVVRVAAPPPTLCRRVNDKLWLGRQVTAVLGEGSIPPSAPAANFTQLMAGLRELRGRAPPHRQVAVRLRSAASGEGNVVIPSDALDHTPPTVLRAMLLHLFGHLNRDEIFPLQVAVWEAPVLASPSIQLWIPPRDVGPPLVEGVFEQRFAPGSTAFAGAAPSSLPPSWQTRLANAAGVLAAVFQELGYVGRCSFDAILVGGALEDAVVHWVECNGRWGGTSIPMTVAERLVGDWTRRPFVVLALEKEGGAAMPAAEALDRLGELVYRPDRREGVVLLSPTALEAGRGVHLMAIAGCPEEAERLAARSRARLSV